MKNRIIMAAVGVSLALFVGGCSSGKGGEAAASGAASVAAEAEEADEALGSTGAEETGGALGNSGAAGTKETGAATAALETKKAGAATTASGAKASLDLALELSQIEDQAAKLKMDIQNAMTQADMTIASSELYKIWDQELNDLWGRLKECLSEEEFSALTEEERRWIASKDAEAKAVAVEYEGGTMYSMALTSRAAELTRERVYELADLLSAKSGRTYENLYAGAYADWQGAGPVSNDLYLDYLGVGVYDAWIGIDQVRCLEGSARTDGNVLSFEDRERQVKGTIAAENAGLVFTVSESAQPEILVGSRFEFPGSYKYREQFSFADIADREFWFGSGAGAWSTVLHIHEDGTFEGEYLDCDMGSYEYYLCDFKGKLSEPRKVDAYTWSVKIDSLELADEPDTSEVKDGWTYHYSGPYGLTDAEELLFYLPGAPIAELPTEFTNWARGYSDRIGTHALLPFYGLYNVNGEQGFSSYVRVE